MPVYDFPIPPFGKEFFYHSDGIKLHKVQKSVGSPTGDKYPPGRTGCNPKGDRTNKH